MLGGCFYNPHGKRLTTTEPAESEIVGMYVLDRYFFPKGIRVEHHDVTVELRADGTFVAKNVPPEYLATVDSDFSGN